MSRSSGWVTLGGMPLASWPRSLPVHTPRTPGRAAAADVSIEMIRAAACGLRRNAASYTPGRSMSSRYVAVPVTSRRSSRRSTGAPIIGVRTGSASAVAVPRAVRLLLAIGVVLPHLEQRLHHAGVAGAAADVAAE